VERPKSRCLACAAPVPFQPGAGSRLCPFCGTINLVREQEIAAPPVELKIDEAFRLLQGGQARLALDRLESLGGASADNLRLQLYRASALLELGQVEDAVYALVDLTGVDAPAHLRADVQAKLAEALLVANRTEEALQAAERAMELTEGHPAAAYQRAMALVRLDRLDEAERQAAEAQPRLDLPWKVTFPPQAFLFSLLLAKIHEQRGEAAQVIQVLEDLLLKDTTCPLHAVATAGRMLGAAYLATGMDRRAAVGLLQHAAQLDPENRFRVLDGLRAAIGKQDEQAEEELEAFRSGREDLLTEVREALLSVLPRHSLAAEQARPEMELSRLDVDPDPRTDRLELAAERMKLNRYDRGTLYPLRTLEDFRRWVASWRLRDRIQLIRHTQAELERLQRLRSTRELAAARPPAGTSLRGAPLQAPPARRAWLGWLLGALGLGLVAATLFAIVAGERFVDHFEGSLVKVQCLGGADRPPCLLHVAAGDAGRRRFRARETATGLSSVLARWLDGRVRADGTIEYPLGFPWGDLPAERYRGCVGQPIAKMRFTLAPLCQRRPGSAAPSR